MTPMFGYTNNGLTFRSVNTSDPSFVALPGEVFFATTPTTAQLEAAFPGYTQAVAAQAAQATYAAAIGAGLQITSTGTSAINGTYGTLTSDLTAMMAMQLAVEAGKPLPAAYWDSKGNHGTLTAAQVTNIADAIFAYEAALVAWVNGGGVGTLPAASATIA